MEEVKDALFSLGGDKALGLDGFSSLFFQRLWGVLTNDLWEVVEESRVESFVLKDFINTFISLIPKNEEIISFGDFRPISLCNTVYKVI